MAERNTDYAQMSVSELKSLLEANHIDTTSAIEKSDLVLLAQEKLKAEPAKAETEPPGFSPAKPTTSPSNAQPASKTTSTASNFSYSSGGGSYWKLQAPPDYSSMSPEEALRVKRSRYRCGSRYVTPDRIPTWDQTGPAIVAAVKPSPRRIRASGRGMMFGPDSFDLTEKDLAIKFNVDQEINSKVAIFRGDMTTLEIDGIVNAANESLLGGGGIDGAIHAAAGGWLREECATLHGCRTGFTKITGGHDLPAKHVLHTVGPVGEEPVLLRSCYSTCLDLVEKHQLRTVGFCCISTGIFGYPLVRATHIAMDTVRRWLERDDNHKKVDKIIFVVFLDHEKEVYETLMNSYFPLPGSAAPAPDVEAAAGADIAQSRRSRWDDDKPATTEKKDPMLGSKPQLPAVSREQPAETATPATAPENAAPADDAATEPPQSAPPGSDDM